MEVQWKPFDLEAKTGASLDMQSELKGSLSFHGNV